MKATLTFNGLTEIWLDITLENLNLERVKDHIIFKMLTF